MFKVLIKLISRANPISKIIKGHADQISSQGVEVVVDDTDCGDDSEDPDRPGQLESCLAYIVEMEPKKIVISATHKAAFNVIPLARNIRATLTTKDLDVDFSKRTSNLDFELARLSVATTSVQFATQQLVVVTELLRMIPSHFTVKEAISVMTAHTPRRFSIPCVSAEMAMTEKYAQKVRRIISIASIPASPNHDIIEIDKISDDLYKEIYKKKGVVFIPAQMGDGKTRKIQVPLFELAAKEGKRPVFICGKRSIVANAFPYSPCNYMNIKRGEELEARGLITVVNSLIKRRFASFSNAKIVFIDELKELLSHVAGGACGLSLTEKDAIRKALESMIKNADLVVITDAHIGKRELEWIMAIRGDELTIYKSPHDHSDVSVDYIVDTTHGQALGQVVEDLKAGKKVSLFTDLSDKQVRSIQKGITGKLPEVRSRIIDAATVDKKDGMDLMKNLDNEVANFDLVIFTPVVSSGVSLMTTHFDKGVILACGSILPTSLLQTTRRFRKLNDWTIAFKERQGFSETDTRQVVINALAGNRGGALGFIPEDLSDPKGLLRFVTNQRRTEAFSKNDYISETLVLLKHFRFKTSRIEHNEALRKAGNSLISAGQKEVKTERYESIIDAKDLTDIQADLLKKAETLSLDDKYLLDSYEIKKTFLVGDITVETLNFDADGLGRALVSNVRSLSPHLLRHDCDAFTKFKHESGVKLFSLLNIDINNGFVGEFWKEDARRLAEWLGSSANVDDMDATNLMMMESVHDRLSVSDKASPVKIARRLLKLYGFEFESKGRKVNPTTGDRSVAYAIDRDSVDEISAYVSGGPAVAVYQLAKAELKKKEMAEKEALKAERVAVKAADKARVKAEKAAERARVKAEKVAAKARGKTVAKAA